MENLFITLFLAVKFVHKSQKILTSLSIYHVHYNQGCTQAGHQVVEVTEFCMLAHSVLSGELSLCNASVWRFFFWGGGGNC